MTVRFQVRGIVQGVGFRYYVLRRARALGVTGWVRNLSDGSVEVVASGTTDQLSSLESWLFEGPSSAMVTAVDKSDISDEVVDGNQFIVK
jgi:acylphosphatase